MQIFSGVIGAEIFTCYLWKRSIFCEPLEKELRKRLVKCFVLSVVLYGAETWTLQRHEQKRLEAFEMWVWRRMESVKLTDTRKKCSCARKSGRRKNNAGNDKEEQKKWSGPLAKKELPAEGCSRTRVRKSRYSGETLQSPIHCCDVTKLLHLFSGQL